MYKLSKYNYFLEHNQRIIYCNGMTGSLFSMSQREHENIQKQFKDLIFFRIQYESVFKRFKDWGFILDDDIDEIDLLRFRNKTEVFSNKNYRLIINPTEDCVFNCWYCNQHKKLNMGGMSDDIVERIKNHVDYMIKKENITGLFLDWFGGEPLMYFDEVMLPIAKHSLEIAITNNLPFTHHVTTNAYLINKDMVQKMKGIKLTSFQITIDGNEERHNKIRNVKGKQSFKQIMNNINLILENIPDAVIVLRLNYDDETLKIKDLHTVFEMISHQYRNRVFPNFVRVWQTVKTVSVNENLSLKKLTDCVSGMGYSINRSNAFQMNRSVKCYGDRFYHTVVNYDGKVYKCTAHTNKELGILYDSGKIEWDQKELSKLYASSTFENQKCLACKHLPICLGTCIQHGRTQMEPEQCALDYSEVSPENFIIETYENRLMQNN